MQYAVLHLFLLWCINNVSVEMYLDTDGIYGLVPQRVIDEEDEKLRTWKQDADLVSVNSDISSLI